MTTARLTYRALSLALAAVITVSMIAGIDTLATTGHAGNSLLACTPAWSAARG